MDIKNGINVLSLFDGMSCGQIALKELGIVPDIYYASEIDKFAITQSSLNFPSTVHLGSVVNVYPELLEDIDLLIGGSPCQSFSFAGKRVGMKTKENEEIHTLERYLELKADGFDFEGYSYLFWEYMRILTDIRQYNPNVLFMLENVEMGKKWEKVLTDAIGVPGIHINSALVSAQNRKRIYWTNIPNITQPADRGILLRDILEDEVDEKYYLKPSTMAGMSAWAERQSVAGNGLKMEVREDEDKSASLPTGSMKSSSTFVKTDRKGNPKANQDKASCFTAGAHSGGNHSDMDCLVSREVVQINPSKESNGKQPYQHNRWYDTEGISPCLNTDSRPPAIVQPKIASMVGRKLDENGTRADNNPNIVAQQRLELRGDEKTGCLTSVQKDNLLIEGVQYTEEQKQEIESQISSLSSREVAYSYAKNGDIRPYRNDPKKSGVSEVGTVVHPNNKSVTVTLAHEPKIINPLSARIRRLTPTECARLQTVPSWYKWACSDTQQYKMLGNGWTVDVIAHIFKHLLLCPEN